MTKELEESNNTIKVGKKRRVEVNRPTVSGLLLSAGVTLSLPSPPPPPPTPHQVVRREREEPRE
jgi:hypothetical protein